MRAVAALLIVFGCFSCAGSQEVSGERISVGSVSVVFTVTPARARVGESVRFAFRLSNNGGKTERLTFPTSKRYDFWVKEGAKEVWRWSQDQSFLQTVTHDEIPSQSSVTYSANWVPAQTGHYVVSAEVEAEGYSGIMKGTVEVS